MNTPYYNFVERRVDDLDHAPIDDIEARQYIPQETEAFDRYNELRNCGIPVRLAIDIVLDNYGMHIL